MEFAKELNTYCKNGEEKIPSASINPFSILSVIKKKLENTNRRWLLIFDDLPKDFDTDKYLPKIKSERKDSNHIICTTNNKIFEILKKKNILAFLLERSVYYIP